MKGKTKKLLFILFTVTICLIVLIVLSANPNSKLHGIYKVVSVPFQFVQKGFSAIGRSINERITILKEYDAVKKKIDELEEKNNSNMYIVEENERLKKENEELRDLLELKGYFKDLELISANVIADDVTDWFSEFTIDIGSSNGVEDGCVVMTPGGIVGIVYNTGTISSKVRCIIDERNTMMCRILRNNELVRVKGMSNENYTYAMKLDRISVNTDLYVGDIIVTAQSAGVYPAGLIIGVVDTISDEDSMTRYAYIEPAVNFISLSEVYVLLPDKGSTADNGS